MQGVHSIRIPSASQEPRVKQLPSHLDGRSQVCGRQEHPFQADRQLVMAKLYRDFDGIAWPTRCICSKKLALEQDAVTNLKSPVPSSPPIPNPKVGPRDPVRPPHGRFCKNQVSRANGDDLRLEDPSVTLLNGAHLCGVRGTWFGRRRLRRRRVRTAHQKARGGNTDNNDDRPSPHEPELTPRGFGMHPMSAPGSPQHSRSEVSGEPGVVQPINDRLWSNPYHSSSPRPARRSHHLRSL